MILAIIVVIFNIICIGVLVWLIILALKALLKYLRTSDVRDEQKVTRQSLAEILKKHRVECKMTQEFVAEAVGVSRQAVSKWENGTSDPSTSNLIVLAKLYGISPEELIREIG
ncbi:MAG: helix-turn-helix transcriptional regulator [Bacillota bacterium]